MFLDVSCSSIAICGGVAPTSVTLPPSGLQLFQDTINNPLHWYQDLPTIFIPHQGLLPLVPGLQRAASLNSLCLRTWCLVHSFPLVLLLMILLVWSQVWCLQYIDNVAEYKYFKQVNYISESSFKMSTLNDHAFPMRLHLHPRNAQFNLCLSSLGLGVCLS